MFQYEISQSFAVYKNVPKLQISKVFLISTVFFFSVCFFLTHGMKPSNDKNCAGEFLQKEVISKYINSVSFIKSIKNLLFLNTTRIFLNYTFLSLSYISHS